MNPWDARSVLLPLHYSYSPKGALRYVDSAKQSDLFHGWSSSKSLKMEQNERRRDKDFIFFSLLWVWASCVLFSGPGKRRLCHWLFGSEIFRVQQKHHQLLWLSCKQWIRAFSTCFVNQFIIINLSTCLSPQTILVLLSGEPCLTHVCVLVSRHSQPGLLPITDELGLNFPAFSLGGMETACSGAGFQGLCCSVFLGWGLALSANTTCPPLWKQCLYALLPCYPKGVNAASIRDLI